MPVLQQSDLVARLFKEFESQEIRKICMYAWWDYLDGMGIITNWTAFGDFAPCFAIGSKLYVLKRNNILVQDLIEKREPTCYNCGQNVQFKEIIVKTCCAEGDFEHPGKMPYCPNCEEEPSNFVLHYG